MSGMIRGLDKVAVDRRAVVARQVRCSTGYTEGFVVEGVARLRPLGVSERALQAVVAVPQPAAADFAGMLLAALERWSDAVWLPAPGALASAASLDADGVDAALALARLNNAWRTLANRGDVVTVCGTRDTWRGERMVWMRRTGRVLRTKGAPVLWGEQIREMARG